MHIAHDPNARPTVHNHHIFIQVFKWFLIKKKTKIWR